MRLDSILSAIYTDLDAWAQTRNVRCSLALDPWNVLYLLLVRPSGFVLVVHYAGDEESGGQDTMPIAATKIEVIIGYNLGLDAVPDMALVTNTLTKDGLLKLVNELRARVLSMRLPADDTTEDVAYLGAEPMTAPNGVPLAAYKLTFKFHMGVDVDEYRTLEVAENEEG